MALLGMTATAEVDIPSLGNVARSESDIRAAIGRLETPSQRIRDRLFWPHSPSGAVAANLDRAPESQGDAVGIHDRALTALFEVYGAADRPEASATWVEALRSWHNCVSSQQYWELMATLEHTGGFEPAASLEEMDALRQEAMYLASEPLLIVARRSVVEEDYSTLQATLEILDSLTDTGGWTKAARTEASAPLLAAIRHATKENRQTFGKQILADTDATETINTLAEHALRHFREHIQPPLSRLQQILTRGTAEELAAREDVAACLAFIASDFIWVDRFIESEQLLNEALTLAEGTVVTVQIERDLAEIRSYADRERTSQGLPPEVLSSLVHARKLIRNVAVQSRSGIVRSRENVESNKPICDAILTYFRSEVQPAIHAALLAIPQEHPANRALRSETAICVHNLAISFTWAGQQLKAFQLCQEAAHVGGNSEEAEAIRRELPAFAESARQERMVSELRPVKHAPGLGTVNGVGTRLYGRTDYDEASGSYATTYYLTFLYIPILPLGRYRVTFDGIYYRFLGKLRWRRFDKWHLGIVCASFLLVCILLSRDPVEQPRPHISDDARYAGSANASSTLDPLPKRDQLKEQIAAGRDRMEALGGVLAPTITELQRLDNDINEVSGQLAGLDRMKNAGMSIDPEDYDRKVKRSNELVTRRKALYSAHKAGIEEYSRLADQDKELVKQYNDLVR